MDLIRIHNADKKALEIQLLSAVISGEIKPVTEKAILQTKILQTHYNSLCRGEKIYESDFQIIDENEDKSIFDDENIFNHLLIGLFGKKSKTIKAELGINKGQLNRDHFGEESLKRIEMVQRIGKSQIGKGVHPMDAVTMAIDIMSYDCIDYND